MSRKILIRCQTPRISFSISELTANSAVLELLDIVENVTGIPPAQQRLLKGYPPCEVVGSDVLSSIHSLGIRSGDSIIVEQRQPPGDMVAAMSGRSSGLQGSRTSVGQQPPSLSTKHATSPLNKSNSFASPDLQQRNVKRKVVSANNSCLFASISYLFENHTLSKAAEMRKLAADVIASDPTTYDSVLLGRSNSEYVDWLRKDTSWGGAPELVVFSNFYDAEINVVDIQRVTLEEFGKDNNCSKRAFLFYNGVHYDPLYMEVNGRVKTIFPRSDEDIKIRALALGSELKEARQCTDLHGFTLKCMVCNLPLKGQQQLNQHAVSSGHMNFREI
ncbi:ubiquitin thioesterase OTU1-like [Corticium candelabrum]|uniref:ubiquitin thioesterase OTU1-like n=1 Tax=Corticium candelabrum TaxID=121492 RepID=UPI002E2752D7|nr:ubiquitin thioesterase OTU1-like [Corticium candelabrum]